MALHIQDAETDRLARELSAATGETITEAVRVALRERMDRTSTEAGKTRAARIAAIEEILDRVGAMPVLDDRSADEIIGYNEQGLFD
ncbi:MAG TPA: type II toxin-antitoxin system VapB family antitoxin [Acidobacteriaceae bacterium]